MHQNNPSLAKFGIMKCRPWTNDLIVYNGLVVKKTMQFIPGVNAVTYSLASHTVVLGFVLSVNLINLLLNHMR